MNNKSKILVIEDEKNISTLLATLLETNGYSTLIAETAKEGITLAASHTPDLIILDLCLPDGDGN